METDSYQSASDLFGVARVLTTKNRKTARGELLKFFADKTGRSMGYVAFKCTGLDMDALYYLQSDMRQANARGVAWGAAFHTALKPTEV